MRSPPNRSRRPPPRPRPRSVGAPVYGAFRAPGNVARLAVDRVGFAAITLGQAGVDHKESGIVQARRQLLRRDRVVVPLARHELDRLESSSPGGSGPRQPSKSMTAQSSCPKWRNSHQSRSGPPMLPYATTKTLSPMPARPAASSEVLRGGKWMAPVRPGRSGQVGVHVQVARAGDVPRGSSSRPAPGSPQRPAAVDELITHAASLGRFCDFLSSSARG